MYKRATMQCRVPCNNGDDNDSDDDDDDERRDLRCTLSLVSHCVKRLANRYDKRRYR